MTCPICGNLVLPVKYAWNKTYCSKGCRLIAQHNRNRDATQKRRHLEAIAGKTRLSTTSLNDTSIIVVDGQPRIKGAVMLEKLMRKQH